MRYKAALATTVAIQGTSPDKIYPELKLVSPKSRRWYKLLSCMLKILKKKSPKLFKQTTEQRATV